LVKACGHNTNVYATEESDIGVVPKKEPNKAGFFPNGSGGSGGKAGDQGELLKRPPATCTQRQEKTLSGLDRIRKAASKDKSLRFTSLMHHITPELLRESYKSLKRDASPGIDDVTWRQYGEQLEARLASLHERVQSGGYRAMPSKRIWIPKADGRQRPIGIAVLEDKIVQHAVVQI
jgi:hypothetical protein